MNDQGRPERPDLTEQTSRSPRWSAATSSEDSYTTRRAARPRRCGR